MVLQKAEEPFGRNPGNRLRGRPDRAQGRVQESTKSQVVKAHDGNVIRYPDAVLLQCAEHANGGIVTAGKDRVEFDPAAITQKFAHCLVGDSPFKSPAEDQPLVKSKAVRLEGHAVSLLPQVRVFLPRGAAQEQDPAPVMSPDQVLDQPPLHEPGRVLVVLNIAREAVTTTLTLTLPSFLSS